MLILQLGDRFAYASNGLAGRFLQYLEYPSGCATYLEIAHQSASGSSRHGDEFEDWILIFGIERGDRSFVGGGGGFVESPLEILM